MWVVVERKKHSIPERINLEIRAAHLVAVCLKSVGEYTPPYRTEMKPSLWNGKSGDTIALELIWTLTRE